LTIVRDLFLQAGEFTTATNDASIGLVRKVLDDFGEIRKIKEVITDHGSQFFANKWTNMVNQRVHSMRSLMKMESSKLRPESNILRPMAKLRNGIILTR
jgi:hypothetical protein